MLELKFHLNVKKQEKKFEAGNKELINVIYQPEIYIIFKIFKADHPGYELKQYTLKNLMVHHYIPNLKLIKKSIPTSIKDY